MTATSSKGRVSLRYDIIRNMTSPEEKANGARSYFANVRAAELLKFDTAENLRSYIPGHPGRQRTLAHKAIASTLHNRPDRFIQLSSGVTVSARDLEVDDSTKTAVVTNGSIINGAQTQGEIRLFLQELERTEDAAPDFHVRVEIMVDPDPGFVVDAAIARNTLTNIQRLSMAGKKQYLDELNASFQLAHPGYRLSTSETDVGDNFVDTLRLLQVLWAMMPSEILPKGSRSPAEARLKSYKNRAFCLVDFEKDVLTKDKPDRSKEDRAEASVRYQYMIDMAGAAWSEYLKWRHHPGWKSLRLFERTRSIRRDVAGNVTVADGIIFPMLASLSEFVSFSAVEGKFCLAVPQVFAEEDLLSAAREHLKAHDGNPMAMGRDVMVYDNLSVLTRMVVRMAGRTVPQPAPVA